MSGHRIWSILSDYPCKKDAPVDKDPPEGQKLPNLSGACLLKVIPSSS